ncbi:MAG: hypothetical protein IPK69_11555 [Phycisphaerales bacterium]|nr:MAG: hypothetical protein IPK69_11555 [Phycisphaerales bacterium]
MALMTRVIALITPVIALMTPVIVSITRVITLMTGVIRVVWSVRGPYSRKNAGGASATRGGGANASIAAASENGTAVKANAKDAEGRRGG